jgi:hypothetical protein
VLAFFVSHSTLAASQVDNPLLDNKVIMILSPYALLLLALLLCSEVVGAPPPGHKKQRGFNAQGEQLPVNRASSPAPAAQPSKEYPGKKLAAITGIPILAEKRVSLEDLMKLEKEDKFVNRLSSDVWPPKVGGVYFTEPRNFVRSISDHFNPNEVS